MTTTAEPRATDALHQVRDYHRRTKHRPGLYARSLGVMDWATQPDPFRRFEGAPRVPLDRVPVTPDPSYDDLFVPGGLAPAPLSHRWVSQLLYDSLALSTWKSVPGSRWALRVNPSSGNLHPTEGYLLLGAVDGLTETPGLFHYQPHDHVLESRRPLSGEAWAALTRELPAGSLFVGLTSIHWREAWKYGERAYRYCQHDVGHAVAAVSLAAAGLGYLARMVPDLDDLALARLLAVDDQEGPEAEHPDLLLVLCPGQVPAGWRWPAGLLEPLTSAARAGRPNRLSPAHHDWPVIEAVSRAAARRQAGPLVPEERPPEAPPVFAPKHHAARQLIRQRRSAVAFDGRAHLSRESFARMLERLMPRPGRPPFEALPLGPWIHPVFFLHRVDGLEPGAYLLPRRPGVLPGLEAALGRSARPLERAVLPGAAPLQVLELGDLQARAREISCHQDIAADGVFAVAMLAEFDRSLESLGPFGYRALHWEAGALGQVLYLEAEAAGIRGTGIGCFFDDLTHQRLGLAGTTFQTLYHFTVGGPLEDPRIQVGEAYAHLEENRG